MDAIHKGWFSELSTMWPGQCLSLEVDEVLYHEKSKYQDVMVLQTYVYSQLYHYAVCDNCYVWTTGKSV